MKTLDQWETDARLNSSSGNPIYRQEHEKILTLIDLVRKKDRALSKIKQNMDTWRMLNGVKTEDYPKPKQADHIMIEEALVLTEKLK